MNCPNLFLYLCETIDFLSGSSGSPSFSNFTGNFVLMHRIGILSKEDKQIANFQTRPIEKEISVMEILKDAYEKNDEHIKTIVQDIFPGQFSPSSDDVTPMEIQ